MPDAGTLPPTPPTVDFAAVEAQPAAAPVEQQPAAMPAQPVVEQPVQPQPVAAQPQMAGGMPVLPQVQAQPAPEQPAQPQAQPVADAGAFQIPGM